MSSAILDTVRRVTGVLGVALVISTLASPAALGDEPLPARINGTSPSGTQTRYATLSGNPDAGSGRTRSPVVSLAANSLVTTTTPSATPSPSAVGQSVTVSALVVNAANGAPLNSQGTVTFKEGNITLAGPLAVSVNGGASFTKSDFAQGAHFIDAFYSGVPGSFDASTGQVLHYVDAATTNPSAGRFCNASALTFPNAVTSGSPYPARINASGMAGLVSKVTIELNGLTHQTPDDLDLMVTGPNGNSLIAFSDVGGPNAVSGLNIVLDSTAGQTLPNSVALSSGTFRPTDFEVGTDIFAAPAPTTSVSSASAVTLGGSFNNSNPNGIWSLWTSNDAAGAQGGGSLTNGWCLNLTMNRPVLTLSKTHIGNFSQGQSGAQYTVTVGSNGPGSTAGTITVVDTVPAGLTVTGMSGSGWSCTVSTGTCTTAATIAANGSLPAITVTVDVAANATSPKVNSVAVSGGGATGASTTDSTIITAVAPDLTVTKVAQGAAFVQGGTVSYLITVTNSGNGSTVGNITLQDNIPTGLSVSSASGTDWTCTLAAAVSCNRTNPIAAGTASVITLAANIAVNAPASITNTASVSGGGETITNNNSGSATVGVTAAANYALTVSVTGSTWGSVVSSPPGISCPGTCAANFVEGTVVTLTRQVNAAAEGEFVGWTAPAVCASAANSANATCLVTMSAAQSAAARFTVTCRLNVDGDSAVRPDTDALMIARRILGVTGASVIAGAFNPSGTRTTEAALNAFLSPRIAENSFDINLDGVTDWRDAAILLRALSGFTGTAVTQELITPGAQRQFWDQATPGGATDGIKQYLNNRCALALP